MRRSLFLSVVAPVFLTSIAAGGVAVAATGHATPIKSVTITSSACPGGKDFCFKPGVLVVTRSTRVVWKNTSSSPHTVTRCDVAHCGVPGGTGIDPGFKSPTIAPGHTFAFTFHHAGTYRYYCKVHGYTDMHAAITVK